MRNQNNNTSDFSKILEGKEWKTYVWGEILEVFRIGDYGIVKYLVKHNPQVEEEIHFHPFIWTTDPESIKWHGNSAFWRDTSTSYLSLESAIVGAIAYKFDGANSQASYFFDKMIGLK